MIETPRPARNLPDDNLPPGRDEDMTQGTDEDMMTGTEADSIEGDLIGDMDDVAVDGDTSGSQST